MDIVANVSSIMLSNVYQMSIEFCFDSESRSKFIIIAKHHVTMLILCAVPPCLQGVPCWFVFGNIQYDIVSTVGPGENEIAKLQSECCCGDCQVSVQLIFFQL